MMMSLLTRPDSVMCLALLATSLLAAGSRPELPWLSPAASRDRPKPSWLPCVVLCELAVASTTWTVLNPIEFAALIG